MKCAACGDERNQQQFEPVGEGTKQVGYRCAMCGHIYQAQLPVDYGHPPPAQRGDTWAISINGEIRYAEIIGPEVAPGWWLCRDEKTGIEFSASGEWLLVRLDTAGD